MAKQTVKTVVKKSNPAPTKKSQLRKQVKNKMKISTDMIKWMKAAGVRAIKTIAQTAVATIGVSATLGTVDWFVVGSTALLAGILSVLTSVAGLPEAE